MTMTRTAHTGGTSLDRRPLSHLLRSPSPAPFVFLPAWLLLGMALVLPSEATWAQTKPVVAPRVDRADINILRGRDIVQIPTLWYQEGDAAPDSVGVLRVARSSDPDAVTYPDARYRFPVNLQLVTFVRDGQIAELLIGERVLRGEIPGRVIIRSPEDDHYDVAEPYGVEPLKQVPGGETIIDAKEWYDASLLSPSTGKRAPDDRFHVTRELRGRLRSTAEGGESVQFVIAASRTPAQEPVTLAPAEPIPPVRDRYVVPEVRLNLVTRDIREPSLDWTTTTALMAGPNRAELPARSGEYSSNRIKGDVLSTFRWHANDEKSYALAFVGSSQASFGIEGERDHHDVPYGLTFAARYGDTWAAELRTEAIYEDDPFQAQSFATADQRLRFMVGVDYRSAPPPVVNTHWSIRLGPTYFVDRASIWEDRPAARELGYSLRGLLDHRLDLGPFAAIVGTSAHVDQSWGYIRDAGHSNTTLQGRLSFKPSLRMDGMQLAIGPVGYVEYVKNEYAEAPGFSEFNLQVGLEATTRVYF